MQTAPRNDAVRDLLGYVSLENTQRYFRGMSVERLRGAVERSYLGGVGAIAAEAKEAQS